MSPSPRPTDLPEASSPDARPKVLLIEDSDVLRMLVVSMLAPWFDVEAEATAEAALQRLAETSYAYLLIDIDLGPGMTGLELMQQLRRREGLCETPMVAVTSKLQFGSAEHYQSFGFDGAVPKPFARADLLREMQRLRPAA